MAEKLKNILFLIFMLLLLSCQPDPQTPSDWSEVDMKIRKKDSLEALDLSQKADPAIENWAGYPDFKSTPEADSLKKNTNPDL